MAGMTAREAAAVVGRTPQAVRDRMCKLAIPHRKDGKHFVWEEEDIRAAFPDAFSDEAPLRTQVRELRERLDRTERKANAILAAQREFQRKAREWFRSQGSAK